MWFLGRQNGLKYVHPGPCCGSSQHSPDLLAALRQPTCKGRERRGKERDIKKGKGDRIGESRRGGSVKGGIRKERGEC